MHDVVKVMLKKYACHSSNAYENALHEIIQEIALLGLWRSKFFEHAAFYGGTALRILYGLDRFSEDLDFSLLETNKTFNLGVYNEAVKAELEAFGFDVKIESKVKNKATAIQSAFIKAGTQKQLLAINVPEKLVNTVHKNKQVKIKMELDIDPPGDFLTEAKLLLQPIPFSVNVYRQSYLFAGKLHALLCRAWLQRIKGRDWYDFVWYVGQNVPVNIQHLRTRLLQSGHWDANNVFNEAALHALLRDKINKVDFQKAKLDVERFVKDPDSLNLWSADFFMEIAKQLKVESIA